MIERVLCSRSKTHLLTLYFVDSGTYAGGTLDWFGWFHGSDLDWIHSSQIDWFLQESGTPLGVERSRSVNNAFKRINRPH